MKTNGFTLIETLVALIILTGAFAVVWNWFGTSTIATNKIERAIKVNAVFDSVMERLALEPLANKRSGHYDIDDYQVRWQATVDRTSTEEPFRRQPKWVATLFNIQISIAFEGQSVAELNTKYYAQWPDSDANALSFDDFLSN
ncbi:hypothetical protein D210916BOD24_27280 [Alteromonas sp. D210916BOD_24]|uniref:prepilin-type N-terminal cleavage/methylation domain-containing protein n=1 Tax=Alteromonas sp. D210916BOD_24 TaxID=3157618 RepID=UPI00399D0146